MGLEEQAQKLDFEGIVIGAIITALAFVMGLFWRDAITETINTLLPEGEGLVFKYVVAILATIIVVIASYLLIRFKRMEFTKEIKKSRRFVKTGTRTLGTVGKRNMTAKNKATKNKER